MGGSISSHFVGLPGGLLMSVIAFSIVFLVIAGLMIMMMLLKNFAAAMEANQSKQAAPADSPAKPAAPGAAAVAAPITASADDGELIAVITAAIAAVCGKGARVVSFVPSAVRMQSTAWRMTGRLQNSEGFAD